MPSFPATAPKTGWNILSDRLKSHKRTAFAVVLAGRVLGDEDKIKVTI